MKPLFVALVISWACLVGGQVDAHHSFAATYLEDKAVTIEGELVQLQYRNPHSFMQVTVMEANGSMSRYAIEWSGVAQLGADGVTKDTLKLGDRLVIDGHPAQNPSDRRVQLVSLRRPSDGFGWTVPPGRAMN
ncbi:MAG: DUF6152 family protein [Acidobacteria bacterium]|nr:DUF6152 family protein [Acidobacteriota bacterium]